ncbi:signal recognition particle-docking protein FtsY [Pseudactinotalea sp. HY158]|uniref:signal recognition particle-docking protein FtsY n=1 Tax=Pseudactinotalea sp. HY158 TaxID=2654547 RepID=UPI00129D10A4|nr:signal recognition particle-docking protein FtsY [Pseudactinotalea sp. HY158]QGH69914.1 signal recognition particle-docking protein FtsY [Pseudactinotalea sp. HY158]
MTDTFSWLLWIALAIVVLVVGTVVFLRPGRGGRRGPEVPPTRQTPPAGTAERPESDGEGPGTGGVDTLAPPEGDESAGVLDTVDIDGAIEQAAPTLERPESAGTRMERLRSRLARSGALGSALLAVLSRDHLTEADWEELEETLLIADVGSAPTDELMSALRTRSRVAGALDPDSVRGELRTLLLDLVNPAMDRSLETATRLGDDGEPHPATILMVGVNGTGKTTTAGKLARLLVAEERDVVLGAADTFRAAAADQLQTWGERVGVPVVRSDRDGADPAAVAFDAVATGRADGADVVIVDTAGRLQNKAGLMDELGKVARVVGRAAPVSEVLLVLDATTGQNGLRQAQVFAEAVGVTGIVLTKLDGTAKGGIVIAVQRELGVPVKFVGLGEGPDDLAPFSAADFVDALLS